MVLTVEDVNDNAPVFAGAPYTVEVTTGQIQNRVTELLTVQASDADIGVNAEIDFNISTPVITTTNTTTTATLTVTATDRGTPSLSSVASVTVVIETPCAVVELSITSNGVLSGNLFCNVDIEGLAQVVLGQNFRLRCNVLANIEATAQFLHNASLITSRLPVPQGQSRVIVQINDAQFQNAGQYSCIGRTSLATLQAEDHTVEIIGKYERKVIL